MNAQGKISRASFGSRGKMACSALAVLLAATLAGCSATTDKSIKTASLTKQVGYALPEKKPARNKQVAATQRAVKLVRTTYLGRAPYVCTPSGFGRTSSCFLR
ncbi:hypothetical protein [Sinorhizobium fredii]|uniref:hypothetical protein n=1 Tax=Rhizobium fredii TaxID=380 RepID=UPI0004AFDC5B|nr:hypothetical protein [Sinorhizobium fredii]AWI60422.1 hypothetical protein AB395_00005245 [Sinorhizobium fredii CCBAU 45436]